MGDFVVKDSGSRETYDSGMVRDTVEGKTNWSLVDDGPMLERWADHLTKGAKKYAPRNWMKARGIAEYQRFRESAFRHFMQWYRGDLDEDHAAAVFFNINGAEYVRAIQDATPEIPVFTAPVVPATRTRYADALVRLGRDLPGDDNRYVGGGAGDP